MSPSGRSRSNHPRTDRPTALTVPLPWTAHRRGGRLHLWLAGSPVAFAESSSLSFGTNPPIPTALHPALRRRGCLPLHPGGCLRDGHDFHMLSSWCYGRTSRGCHPRIVGTWYGHSFRQLPLTPVRFLPRVGRARQVPSSLPARRSVKDASVTAEPRWVFRSPLLRFSAAPW